MKIRAVERKRDRLSLQDQRVSFWEGSRLGIEPVSKRTENVAAGLIRAAAHYRAAEAQRGLHEREMGQSLRKIA